MGEEELGNISVCEGREWGETGGEGGEGGTERGAEVKELRMSAIFSSKNAAKSSAVMEDWGGGAGMLRRARLGNFSWDLEGDRQQWYAG